MDNKLNWKDHIIKKRKQMDLRHKELYWLLGRKSHVSVDNKFLLYKSIIAPTWTYEYDIELWGCAWKTNIAVMQRCQSKILRAIVDAPWFVTNDNFFLHKSSWRALLIHTTCYQSYTPNLLYNTTISLGYMFRLFSVIIRPY